MNSTTVFRKTLLATALLAATSFAFAGDKPSSPPGGGHAGGTAPTELSNGADHAAAAHERHDAVADAGGHKPLPDDPVSSDGDLDDDGLPDDDDGDDNNDGEIDQFEPQPANTYGQQTSDAARADDREDGGLNQSDAAQARNDLRALDTDADGTNDYLDTDDDGDGITDTEELDEDEVDG